MLTAEYLRQIIDYNPETGVFTRDGKPAGYINADGYRVITIDCTAYLAHRLAVLYVTGEWPRYGVSHRNDDRADNRWCNLRSATMTQTARNRRASNKLGIKGVRMTPRGHYRAGIFVNKRNLNLGTFTTIEGAADAYANAARLHFGEFARTA